MSDQAKFGVAWPVVHHMLTESVVLMWQQALTLCTQYGSVVLQNIAEVNRSASLVSDLRDTSKQRLRGVIQLSIVEELGKVTPRDCPHSYSWQWINVMSFAANN